MATATTAVVNENGAYKYWEDDEWTEQEEEAVRQELESNKVKCRMVDQPHKRHAAHRGPDWDENAAAWDRFYRQHQANFFKDRHYLMHTFPEEFDNLQAGEQRCLVELGCGVGNALLPLLDNPQWSVYGFDISAVAIELLRQDDRFRAASDRAYCATADLSSPTPLTMANSVATVASLLFTLSAVDRPDVAVQHAASVLKPGGVLILRDYGRYDQAQLQLGRKRNRLLPQDQHCSGDYFYRKEDGTKCYYFTLEDVEKLVVQHAGLEVLDLRYIKRTYRNRSTGEARRRVWIQGRFRKPLS